MAAESLVMAIRERDEGLRLYYPAVGAIQALFGLFVLTYLVAVTTPVLVSELATIAPSLVPEPLSTAGAAVLWLALLSTLLALFGGRVGVSTHTFQRREDVAAFVRSNRPSPVWVVGYALGTAAGAGVTAAGSSHVTPAFIATTQYGFDVLRGEPSAIPVTEAFWLLVSLGGVWLLAVALDRLVVACARIAVAWLRG
jgi:hypothetical protein